MLEMLLVRFRLHSSDFFSSIFTVVKQSCGKMCGYKDDGVTRNRMLFDSRNARRQRETDFLRA